MLYGNDVGKDARRMTMGIFSSLFKKEENPEEDLLSVFPQEIYRSGELSLIDVISPAALEINPSFIRLGEKFARTIFVFSYPRYLHTNWFSPIINLDIVFDISIFVHPVDTPHMLPQLPKHVAPL